MTIQWTVFNGLFFSLVFCVCVCVCVSLPQASADQSSFVKGMLTSEYPRLRAVFMDMWATAHKDTDAGILLYATRVMLHYSVSCLE